MTTATKRPVITYERPKLAAYQLDALFCSERYGIIEATSKAGKTVGAMAWLLELALEHGGPNRNYWWVGPVLVQADIAFGRIKHGLPQQLYTTNESKRTITMFNGAVIWFKSADNPDSLYGEDVYGAVIDEATRCKEESFHAVRSTLTATRGPLRIIGNVKGRQNWAYRLARKAESGEPNMHYAKITAMDAVAAGILDVAEVEDARQVLPDAVFRELYMAEPSDDGGNPFGLLAIAACVGIMHACPAEYWGWDLAGARKSTATDWTWGIGICAHNAVCRIQRFQNPWPLTFEILKAAGSGQCAQMDSTGAGDPILEFVQRSGAGNYEGYVFSQPSKQRLIESLAVSLQNREITIPDTTEGQILRGELEAFEYVYTRSGVHYSAPEGLKDDGVCALALANWARRQGGVRVWAL